VRLWDEPPIKEVANFDITSVVPFKILSGETLAKNLTAVGN